MTELSVNKALTKAKSHAKKGETEEAKKLFQAVLKAFPKNKRAQQGLIALNKSIKSITAQDPPIETINKLINFYSQGQLHQALKDAKILLQLFPSSSVLYNICGAVYKDLEQLDASVQAYKKALSINPDYTDVYYNMGIALKGQGKLEEAIESYNKAISNKPDYADAHNNMGNALQEQHKLEEAIEAYKKALSINPGYVDAYYNMGNALKDQGKLDEAIVSYNKALEIKPDDARSYNSMGIAFREQDKLEEAIGAYNKALAIKPNYAEACNNMGNALQEQSKLEEAIAAYNTALAIKPDYAGAIENRLNLLTQLQGGVLIRNKKFNQITQDKQLEMVQTPKSYILHAISSFLSADKARTKRYIHNFKTCSTKLTDSLTHQDQVFCFAFSEYLSEILKEPLTGNLNLNNDNIVYHIGESHCLSYAHHNIEINGATFRIAPMITFGAKAFHFSKANDCAFKAITKANLDAIPKGSMVFVSFGEIDCRPNEGFIFAAIKLDQSVEDIIANTVTGYLQWFDKQNKAWNHIMHFVNVPAPKYDQRYDAKKNADVANVVNLFNQQMKKQIVQYYFNMLDVFQFTHGKDGFSNNRFHIDEKHLGGKALSKIEQQLKS